MQTKSFNKLFGFLVAASVALVLVGCRGSAGQTGATGPAGPAGPVGPTGPIGPVSTPMIDASQYTADQWTALSPSVTVNKVAITNGKPEVTFTVKDGAGNIIKGMDSWTSKSATASLTSYPNFAFAVAKLVPEDATTKAPSKWVSYIISSTPNLASPTATPTRPTTDNTGTLTFDANTGTYKYAFYRDIAGMKAWLDAQTVTGANNKADLGDLTFDKTLVHRLTVQFSGNLRGTGSNTPNGVTSKTAVPLTNPVNAIFDFIPGADLACAAVPAGTDVRDVISIGKCNECHDKLAFHGGGRVEARYCAVCHTDQRKYGYAVATAGTTTTYSGSTNKFTYDGTNTYAAGDLTVMVHKIHMGTELTKTGYNYANVKFETIGYSMLEGGQKLCLKCHSNVAQADNWFNKPSRLACGSCHDGIDWATGAGHTGPHGNGGPQVNDQNCANCHLAIYTKGGHRNQDITPHNPTIAMGLKTPVYEVKSAAVSGTTATVVFKITMDGTPVTYVPAVAGVVANPLTGFTGGPSFLFAYALPQDGVTAPIDYNNLGLANGQPKSVSIASLLNTTTASTNGSMTGPDASGYYTATIINAFPAAAKLRSVSLQGYFTQNAGTWDSSGNGQIDSTDTATSPRHAVSVIKAVTGDTARRTVIDSNRCQDCHEWFMGHGGNRVKEVQVCVTCHNPSIVTSGKGMTDTALETYRAAGLFTATDLASLSSWGITIPNPVVNGSNFALAFPQTSNNFKDMIHGIHAGKDRTNPIRIVRDRTPSAVNIINGANVGFPGILSNCQSCHTYNGYNIPTANVLPTREEAINPAGNTTTALAKAAIGTLSATDLMITPFTAACVTCHDTVPAKAHMTLNGGQIKVARSSMNLAGESCAVCHGAGSTYDPVKVHQ